MLGSYRHAMKMTTYSRPGSGAQRLHYCHHRSDDYNFRLLFIFFFWLVGVVAVTGHGGRVRAALIECERLGKFSLSSVEMLANCINLKNRFRFESHQ